MSQARLQDWLAIIVTLFAAGFVTWAASQGSLFWHGWSVIMLCAGLVFGIQWLVYIPSYLKQTEHYFDLTGSATYIVVMLVALFMSQLSRGSWDLRSILLASLVILWAIRLGSFLFKRITEAGFDRRFNAIKLSYSRFLMTWTLQGLWVFLTASSALAAITSVESRPPDPYVVFGFSLWFAGFSIEVIADSQKRRFRSDSQNANRYIATGLWAWSRHPNYFGEILLWIGITIIALPVLSGWQLVTLVSPLFVFVLLTRISGVPMLERRADKRWGEEEAYQRYKLRTPTLLMRPPQTGKS